MTKKPHEETRLAKYVERRVLELRPKKSQLEIANAASYPTARVSSKSPLGERDESDFGSKGRRAVIRCGYNECPVLGCQATDCCQVINWQ